jgi:ABC-type transport system substrate-binding protein
VGGIRDRPRDRRCYVFDLVGDEPGGPGRGIRQTGSIGYLQTRDFRMRDTDPAMNLDFWLSSGSRHLWNPNQAKPATEWERRIDEPMLKHAATFDRVERVQLFAEVQRIFAEHMPAVYLGRRS